MLDNKASVVITEQDEEEASEPTMNHNNGQSMENTLSSSQPNYSKNPPQKFNPPRMHINCRP